MRRCNILTLKTYDYEAIVVIGIGDCDDHNLCICAVTPYREAEEHLALRLMKALYEGVIE